MPHGFLYGPCNRAVADTACAPAACWPGKGCWWPAGDGYKRELPLAPPIAQCPPRYKIITRGLMMFLQHAFFVPNPVDPLWSAYVCWRIFHFPLYLGQLGWLLLPEGEL